MDNIRISIHAPTRGATGIPDAIFYKYRFQSTLPREERPGVVGIAIGVVNFNPRSHERSDCLTDCTFFVHQKFQSTLPREERPLL